MDLIKRTVQRAILDAKLEADREASVDLIRQVRASRVDNDLCCPNHGQCLLGCFSEADEED